MAAALQPEMKARLTACYEELQAAPEVVMAESEKTKLAAVIEQQCAVRHAGRTGDHVEQYCLDQSWASVDIKALCPDWYAAVEVEYNKYQLLRSQAKQGIAYANMLMRQVSNARPELESLEALLYYQVGKIREQIHG